MAPYTNIVLDAQKILSKLEIFADEGSVQEASKGNSIHYTFLKDGLPALLIVFKKANGKVTLQVSAGQNPSVSELAAAAILGDTAQPVVDNATITVEKWSGEKFEALVNYLVEECEASKCDPQVNESVRSTQVKVIGCQGDSISLTFFESTSKLLVQGRPVLLIREAVSFIGSYSDVNSALYLEYLDKIFGTTTDIGVVEAAIKCESPNSYVFEGQTFKKILISAYQMLGCNIDFADGNVYIFDAFRALEYFIKQLFYKNGKQIDSRDGFSGLFKANATRSCFKLIIPFACGATTAAIEECYGYYVANRHEGFHASAVPMMTQILKPSEAKSKAKRALELIECHCAALAKV